MGVLTDYFVAKNDADAARAHASPGGPKHAGFSTAEWKSIDPVVCMAALDEVVTGRNALEWIKSKPPDSAIAGSDDDEHWVFRVYDHHFALLTTLTDEQLPDVARRWAAQEEVRDLGPDDVRELLTDLVRLGRDARAAGAQLYCWVSL